jgi:AbrB family looped-hinge helix DNA binding protein
LTLLESEIAILREVFPMKITSKGQVTIPVEIREKLGLVPNSEVEFELVGRAVRMRKVRKAKGRGRRGKSLVARLRGKGSVRMTTDEILALTRSPR